MATSISTGTNSGRTRRDVARRRIVALVSSVALMVGVLAAGALPASADQVLPVPLVGEATSNTINLGVESAGSGGTDAAAVKAGDAVSSYKFLLQKVERGNALDPATNCLPPSNDTSSTKYDPNYPNNCQWPGTRDSNTGDPIITSGTEVDLSKTHTLAGLPDGEYLVSVKADGFEIGGGHFTIPIVEGTADAPNVVVKLSPYPLPLATIRVRVFHDIAPVDGVYEIGAEPGLAGYRAFLNDLLGDVSTDYFGNPLCTEYDHYTAADEALDPAHRAGTMKFDADGAPIISATSTGQCISSTPDPANGVEGGDIVIPNMAPGRYGITIRQPNGSKNWMQTTTLEGAQDHDWWVMAGDTGWGQETVYGGELVPEVQFGFVDPRTTSQPIPGGGNLSARGRGSISGAVHKGCTYVGSNGGAYVPNAVPGAPGTNDCGPIKNPYIAVSALDLNDQEVYAGTGNTDGTYTVPNLRNGNYTVTVWDPPINHILETFNVTITNAGNGSATTPAAPTTQAGVTYLGGWFTKITGSVFVDTNGNGRRDAGEQGVVDTTLTFRERDNTPMDQFTNAVKTDSTGHYTIEQGYPLTRWLILEHANPRYKPIGYTTQACNEGKPTTHLGGAVDVAILPVLGLCGNVDWAVEPFSTGQTGGIAGTISYGTTRNETDPTVAATEDWQPGISGVPVHLYAVVRDANGDPVLNGDGSYKQGPELANPYISETFHRPSGCTARDRLGNVMTDQKVLPAPGNENFQCVEAPLVGWQAKPNIDNPGGGTGNTAQEVNGNYGFSTSKLNLLDPATTPTCSADAVAAIVADQTYPATACVPTDDNGAALALYAPLDGSTLATPQSYVYPEMGLKAGDYIVSAEMPKDSYGKDMYKFTSANDVNIFQGDDMLPQENFPVSGAPVADPGTPMGFTVAAKNGSALLGWNAVDAATGYNIYRDGVLLDTTTSLTYTDTAVSNGTQYAYYVTSILSPTTESPASNTVSVTPGKVEPVGGSPAGGLGVNFPCAGADYTVHVTDQPFLDGGGSPYEGQTLKSCSQKLVSIADRSTAFTNFEMFTDVPLATHFWGLILNDLGVSSDPTTIQYGEVEGLKNVPTGIYDWAGNLVDTVLSDYNGFYEAVEPSTTRINNPSPTGVSPNMYRFVGNDPGSGDHLNPNYDPRYRTIATNFQGWPGLWTVTDTAPTLTANQTYNGQMSTVKCTLPGAEPQIFTVNNPVAESSATTSLTISGRDFGQQTAGSAAYLGAPDAAADSPTSGTSLPITSWTDTSITVSIPAGSTPGARELSVRRDTGQTSSNGVTIHVRGGSYTPTIIEVGPGKQFDTDSTTSTTPLQDAIQFAGDSNSTVVVAYPRTPTAIAPRGEYVENIVLHSGVRVQGIGAGGFAADGSYVAGSIITGAGYDEGGASGVAWGALVGGLLDPNADGDFSDSTVRVPSVTVPDAATVTILSPTGGTGSTGRPGIDGFTITGGAQQTIPTNINVLTGGQQTPYANGAVVTQGGGVYIHGGSTNVRVTNNVIDGNSGSYGGGIRVGTPYVNTGSNVNDANAFPLTNTGLVISHNRVTNNGGANLAGGIGIFSGTSGYRLAYNDVCGNFGAEYGGALAHYGLSPNARVDHNRVWFNASYDEGGALMFAGEVTPVATQVSTGSGAVTIEANRIAQNLGNDDGGGIRLLQAGTARIAIVNNEIVNNVSTHEGAGIALNDATNVVIDNNTISGNITTATAVTSNGRPAPAGIALSRISDPLLATLPVGSVPFTNPVLFNNVMWDNRAGTYDGISVLGIGATGDATAINNWDIGSLDGSGPVAPTNSVYQYADSVTASPTNVVADPQFRNPRAISVTVDARRSVVVFRQTVIIGMTGNPFDLADYRLSATSPARGLGAASKTVAGVTYPAPTQDIVGAPRVPNDAGAWSFSSYVPPTPSTVTVTPGANSLAVTWKANLDSGGNPITGYTARAWDSLTGGVSAAQCTTATLTCTISGLTNGTTYYVDVTATTSVGTGAPTNPRVAGTPAGRPSQPFAVGVARQLGALDVWWQPPSDTGGLPITSYTARAYSTATGNTVRSTCTVDMTAPGALPKCTITGLTAGVNVFISVTATNGVSTSLPSAPRVAKAPFTVPGAPVVSASSFVARDHAVQVTWAPPVSDGGTPVTSYRVRVYSAGGTLLTSRGCTVTAPTLTCTDTGLTNGQTYLVAVTATNLVGTGPETAQFAVTPRPAPTQIPGSGVIVTRGNTALTITWPAATLSGGAPAVTGYTVSLYSALTGGNAVRTCTTAAAVRTCTITGLTNAANYYAAVSATNAMGTSVESTPRQIGTPSASPATAPGAPTSVGTSNGQNAGTSRSVNVTWNIPGSTGGSTISGFTATAYNASTGGAVQGTCAAAATATTCRITGLARNTTYWFSVSATNSIGSTTSTPRVSRLTNP
jgi:hypothetical protein